MKALFLYVGGNRDLTSALARGGWSERQGPTHCHFRYKDALFLVLDANDNTPERVEKIAAARAEATDDNKMPERSAGANTAAQSHYFMDAIAANWAVRQTLLFVHKPVWEREDSETYGPIEAVRSEMPYTVCHGHEHACLLRPRNTGSAESGECRHRRSSCIHRAD